MVWGIRAVFRPTGRLVISLCSLWIYEQQISSCLMDDGRQPNVALHDACLIILYRLTWSTYIDSLSFPHDIHSWLCTRRPLRTTSPSGHDGGGFFRRALDVGRCCGGSRAEANVLLAKSDIQSYGQLWHRAKGIDLPIDWNNKQSSMMYCIVYVCLSISHYNICPFFEKQIGKGQFSVVHRATCRENRSIVALKKVQIFEMVDAKSRLDCMKEIQLLQVR